MGLFKTLKRKRQLKKLAKCNEKITYYSKSIENDKKIIAEFQKLLDANHAIPPGKSSNLPDLESGIFFLNQYAASFIKQIDNKRKNIALATSNISYWETLKKDILSQSELQVVDIAEKPFS